nr:kinetochore protein spc24-like isoform X1 [Procambarus clarkii]
MLPTAPILVFKMCDFSVISVINLYYSYYVTFKMVSSEGEVNIEHEMQRVTKLTSSVVAKLASTNVGSLVTSAKDSFTSAVQTNDHTQQLLDERLEELLHVQEMEKCTLDELRSQTLGPRAQHLLSQIAQANREKSDVENEIASLVSSIVNLEQLDNQLNTRTKSTILHNSTSIPKMKADISTFTKISNLKWDYCAPEDVVKGFIYQPQKRDIIPFKFDKGSHSQFFITNFLWEQIGTDNDFLQ